MSSLSDELAYADVTDIAGRIRRKKLSPVEVVDAFLERIDARNPSITALTFVDHEGARAEAKAAEQKLMQGGELGPLFGVPGILKDLFDFKPGWPATAGGVRALKDFRPDLNCVFSERVQQAGAILLGKGNSPTFGFRGTCDNYLFGPSRNPFNTKHNTGGSSGGSAGAVADGLVPFAEGTDGGGSIRIPASWCGVFGYKQSWGRVPTITRPNAFGGNTPFIFEGPLTRSVADAALVLTAINGPDDRDPFSLPEKVDFIGATSGSIKGMRIAWSPDLDVFPVDPKVAEVVAQAVKVFEEAGAIVEPVKLGIKRSHYQLAELWCRLILPLNIGALEAFKANGLDLMRDHADDFPPALRNWIERGYQLSAVDIERDQVMRTEIFDAIHAVMATHDFLISPTLACLAVENADDGDTMGPAEINGEQVERLIGWCMTYFINFTGHPAASLPAGLAANGLPVGLQIVGRRHADADLLAACATFERLRPWKDSYRIPAGRKLG
ncbi:MAG TPA: amidase family protein [Geminicoccus sp.]|jgi:amidase/aspartyl-tRNA(Asn)/glutamyl-tRNA(Gln) amidotransferase subunit A|uniref:amidase n=1 Tax=Geminicoccus sp. TaxID=2024832 RepID=UPI002E308AB6|nr:amidase family protein [Geminicoccus sp.]HEX2527547.1 amidase family protein [Geminicoccus sp.]